MVDETLRTDVTRDPYRALLIADDLTGALDSGHSLARRSQRVVATLADDGGDAPADSPNDDAPADSPNADVLVVDTDSRAIAPAAAARRVRRAIERHAATITYKKIDSTLRGNVSSEVDAALAATGAALAVVAPAFPATGRRTRDGVHYVDGDPLAEAGYGVDDSDVAAAFADSDHPLERLPLEIVSQGADAVAERLRALAADTRPTLVICDAVDADHLRAVADGAASTTIDVLYVGSGGLAEHVALPESDDVPPPPTPSGTGALGVIGSVNPRTLTQLSAVDEDLVVRVDPVAAVREPTAVPRRVAPRLASRLRERGRAVVTAAVDVDDVERARAAAAGLDMPDIDVGDRIAGVLGATAARVTVAPSSPTPAGLCLSGGHVARTTLEALSATQVGLTGCGVDDGIPIGWIGDGPGAGVRLATKAGGFGSEGAIVNCLRVVAGDHE